MVGSQIGENQSALFLHRIRQMLHLFWKFASLRLSGHFETLAVNIEQPTMVCTPKSPVFNIAIFQRRSAVRTMLAEQSKLSRLIAKQHQLFAENFHRLRNVVEITRDADDEPIAAKPFAGRRAKTNVWNVGESDFLQTFH